MAGRDALMVRRLAGAGRAVRPGRGIVVPHGGAVAHEDQQRAARGALQPGHGAHRHGDRVRRGPQGVRTVARRRRAQDGVRDPPVQSRRGADPGPVRSHLQGEETDQQTAGREWRRRCKVCPFRPVVGPSLRNRHGHMISRRARARVRRPAVGMGGGVR